MSITDTQVRDWLASAPVQLPVEFREIGNDAWFKGEVCADVNGSGPGIKHTVGLFCHRAAFIAEIRVPSWAVGPFRTTRYIDDDHWEYEVVDADNVAVFAAVCSDRCIKALASLRALGGEAVKA